MRKVSSANNLNSVGLMTNAAYLQIVVNFLFDGSGHCCSTTDMHHVHSLPYTSIAISASQKMHLHFCPVPTLTSHHLLAVQCQHAHKIVYFNSFSLLSILVPVSDKRWKHGSRSNDRSISTNFKSLYEQKCAK